MFSPRSIRPVLVVLLLAGLVPSIGISAATSALPTEHLVAVSGAGVSTYPEFAQETERYGVRTTADASGTVEVSASTSDPTGRVFVNGRLAEDSVQLTGLAPRDEVSVIIKDSSGASAYSFIYLPPGFPVLTGTASPQAQPGHTLMTLNPFSGVPARFMTAVDGNGVPAHLVPYTGNRHDLKQHPNGTFSVSQDVALPAGNVILDLDDDLHEVARHSTVALKNTDFHDYQILDDGNRLLMAYEPRDNGSRLVDAVIQEIAPDGELVFEWDSGHHIDVPTEAVRRGEDDYAHINSAQVMSDGDYLLSMRHLSVVVKVAHEDQTEAGRQFEEGDIIWRLGGRLSDFRFPDDPLFGPCAQHTASEVTPPGGPTTILVFDNGSFDTNPGCVDPEDRSGAPVHRTESRVVEFVLDEEAGTATVGREHAPGRFADFAGSAERLDNGNTLVGWTNAREGIASELDPDFEPIWELSSQDGYGSYRVDRATVPDTSEPTALLTSPRSGDVYAFGQSVRSSYECTDRGGSGLQACEGSVEEGTALDTRTPGTHTFDVIAVDGDGNTTTRSVTYTVLPAPVVPQPEVPGPTTTPPTTPPSPAPMLRGPRPDAVLVVGGRTSGDDEYAARQSRRLSLTESRPRRTVRVRVGNDGDVTSTLVLDGPASRPGVHVRAMQKGRDVTRKLRRGTLRVTLAPGAETVLRVTLTRRDRPRAKPSTRLGFSVSAGDLTDTVRLRVVSR